MSQQNFSEQSNLTQVTEGAVKNTSAENLVSCLAFESGDLTMFLSTDYVTEIIKDQTITYLPLLPAFVKGVINLRGSILPVIDIRVYMGKPEVVYDSRTCIIVLDINSVSLGIIVDSVHNVMDIDKSQVRPIPLKRQQKLLNGMIKHSNGNVLMSFDIDALTAEL